jgi:hypothetical protein
LTDIPRAAGLALTRKRQIDFGFELRESQRKV